jgi:hypothetical protein
VHFLTRFLLMLCVFAGLGAGMAHGYVHGEKDECASHCQSDHGNQQDPADQDDHGPVPHHHDCCHFPNADRTTDSIYGAVTFRTILVEIPTDCSLIPDEPVFALDKPPLI